MRAVLTRTSGWVISCLQWAGGETMCHLPAGHAISLLEDEIRADAEARVRLPLARKVSSREAGA